MKRPFVRRSKSGVTRIVRDSYGASWGEWRTTASRIKERDGNKCSQCGSTHRLHVHHIRPLSRGGTTSDANMITLCEECHDKKHKHNVKVRR